MMTERPISLNGAGDTWNKNKAEFKLERIKRFFLSLCSMRISFFRMRILVCEVEK